MTMYGDEGGSSRGCFFWGCISCVVLAFLAAAGVGSLVFVGYQKQASVRDAGKAYLDATETGDFETAYGLLSPALAAEINLEQFVSGETERRATLAGCEDWKFSGLNLHRGMGQETSTQLAYMTTCNEQPYVLRLEMVKREGEWRVAAAHYASPNREVTNKCPACGAAVSPAAKFCSQCGAAIDRTGPVPGEDLPGVS